MAIYQFECAACGERFDVTKPMSQHEELKEHRPPCPKCGNPETRELAPLIGYKAPSSS
jgi:putative FmdB family regulatory protein